MKSLPLTRCTHESCVSATVGRALSIQVVAFEELPHDRRRIDLVVGPPMSEAVDAYHAHIGPVPITGLLTGLSLLVARRALMAEEEPT